MTDEDRQSRKGGHRPLDLPPKSDVWVSVELFQACTHRRHYLCVQALRLLKSCRGDPFRAHFNSLCPCFFLGQMKKCFRPLNMVLGANYHGNIRSFEAFGSSLN